MRKTLGLVRKGNATPAEWLDSPVVYRGDVAFARNLREALKITCQPRLVFHHYLHMARGQWRDLGGKERVRLKKYFYVLRPLLAALWIEREGTWPPMPFHDLLDAIVADGRVRSAIDDLLRRKRDADEAKRIEPVAVIDIYVQAQFQRLADCCPVESLPDCRVLDRLLFETVMDGRTTS